MEVIWFFHIFYSIDKQMIPYTWKNSSNQTIRTKSIRFGYKSFVLYSADCYSYFIDSDSGVEHGEGKVSKSLCAQSVIDCITEIDHWDDKKGFLYNWFSLLPLITVLMDQGIPAMRTVRTDRLGKELELNKKSIKIEVTGTIKCHYEKNGIGVIS